MVEVGGIVVVVAEVDAVVAAVVEVVDSVVVVVRLVGGRVEVVDSVVVELSDVVGPSGSVVDEPVVELPSGSVVELEESSSLDVVDAQRPVVATSNESDRGSRVTNVRRVDAVVVVSSRSASDISPSVTTPPPPPELIWKTAMATNTTRTTGAIRFKGSRSQHSHQRPSYRFPLCPTEASDPRRLGLSTQSRNGISQASTNAAALDPAPRPETAAQRLAWDTASSIDPIIRSRKPSMSTPSVLFCPSR